jgi:hypothetical protein
VLRSERLCDFVVSSFQTSIISCGVLKTLLSLFTTSSLLESAAFVSTLISSSRIGLGDNLPRRACLTPLPDTLTTFQDKLIQTDLGRKEARWADS